MTFEFDRRPDKEEIAEGCKNILITFTDYSLNISIVSYLVTITTTGRPSVIILQARTLNRKLTVPKGELDGLKEGSIQHKTLMTELGDIISEDYILTDSMICIYQLLNDKEHENPFVENRAREINRTSTSSTRFTMSYRPKTWQILAQDTVQALAILTS